MGFDYFRSGISRGPGGLYRKPEVKDDFRKGVLGALLFSLGGGVLWVLLFQIGFFAAVTGAVTLFLAVTGYRKFGGKLGTGGLVLSVIFSVVVLLIAWNISLGLDVTQYYREEVAAGRIQNMPNFFQAIVIGLIGVLSQGNIAGAYVTPFVFALVLLGATAFFYAKKIREAKRAEKKNEPGPVIVDYQNPVIIDDAEADPDPVSNDDSADT